MGTETYRQRAWSYAIGQYGYFTARDARELGIPVVELGKLSARGQIRHIAYGLYRFEELPPTRYDVFFEAVARVGTGAHLSGDAVLALHELAQVNPRRITVGTPRRVRTQLPDWVRLVRESLPESDLTRYEMVASTTVARAIQACLGTVISSRLIAATDQATNRGLIRRSERDRLIAEIESMP